MASERYTVEIPESLATISVSIIDTSVRFQKWAIDAFVEKPKIAGHNHFTAPSWSFKIVHPEHGAYLFDLGVRKDWEKNMTPKSLNILKQNAWTFSLNKDVAQILTEHGDDLNDIKGIIWSHWHWDHIGDPTTFPKTTKLVVGPGFKSDILPGWPQDPQGRANSDAWEGRQLEEIEMSKDLNIGGYAALDYFGDGSFYLLHSPGHTVDHICALARTTSGNGSTFIFMGGDVAHMIGQIVSAPNDCPDSLRRDSSVPSSHISDLPLSNKLQRPTSCLPLPEQISPDPQKPIDQIKTFCPSAGYVALHPHGASDKPYYRGSAGMATDRDRAESSTRKLEAFDADNRVFTVIAHDDKLEGIIDLYPQTANDWKAKGWKELCHWRFLGDFQVS